MLPSCADTWTHPALANCLRPVFARRFVPDVREVWEESKQRALRIVLAYFDISYPTRRQLALARAWLALFDELVLAWLQTSTIGKESVVRISVNTFRHLISRADLLDRQMKRAAVRRNSGGFHTPQA